MPPTTAGRPSLEVFTATTYGTDIVAVRAGVLPPVPKVSHLHGIEWCLWQVHSNGEVILDTQGKQMRKELLGMNAVLGVMGMLVRRPPPHRSGPNNGV
jgi:hypothetical protein